MTLHSALNRYYITYFLKNFASAIPAGVLILFMVQRGLGLGDVGLLFLVASVTVILLELPTGGLADAVGRKKVAVASYLFGTAAVVALLFITNIQTALVYAVCLGLAQALGSGSLEAWFIDQIKLDNPDVDLQPFFAKETVVETVANAAGALLGGLLPVLIIQWGVGVEPLATPLILSLIVRSAAFVALLTLIPNDAPEENATLTPLRDVQVILGDAFALVGKDNGLKQLLAITLANGVALGSLEAFWQPHFRDTIGISMENTVVFGVVQAVGFLFGTAGGLLATRFVAQFSGNKRAAMTAQVIKALLFFVLAVSTNFIVTTVVFALFYLVLVLNISPHMALYNHTLPNNRRSALLSISSIVLFMGVGGGSAAVGWLSAQYGFGAAFLFIGVVTFVSALLYLKLPAPQPVAEVEMRGAA